MIFSVQLEMHGTRMVLCLVTTQKYKSKGSGTGTGKLTGTHSINLLFLTIHRPSL